MTSIKTESTSIFTEYINLTQEYQIKYGPRTILLMQVGAFFEVYGLKDNEGIIHKTHITEFAQLSNLNISEKKATYGEYQVVMAGFRDYTLEKYLQKITEGGYSAVVYVQEKDGKNITRTFHSVHSAGTYISYETDMSPQITNNIMCVWIDKYKPNNIKEYEHSYSIKNLLINIIKKQYVPNILLYGPSGSGKSSAAFLISKNITNIESVLYINASDEKGIKTIRDTIKTFINIKSNNIKMIILDEADELSEESQLALRKIIELKSYKIRFIIICNYINNIINSLRSRFLNIKLNRLNLENINKVCNKIIKKEQIIINEETAQYLYNKCNLDIRKILIILQKLYQNNDIINKIDINDYMKIIDDRKILLINNYKDGNKIINKLISNGYNAYDILILVIDYIKELIEKDNNILYTNILLKLVKLDYIISKSSNNFIYMIKLIDIIIKINIINNN